MSNTFNTVHFRDYATVTSTISGGITLLYVPKPPLLVKLCGHAHVFYI